MSRTLWFITEDDSDYEVIKQVFQKKNIVNPLQQVSLRGNAGGISRLAHQLPELVDGIKDKKSWRKGDCIVVLYDLDSEQQDRAHYDFIAKFCKENGLIHLVADDKIESWLMSDEGLCKFLEIKPKRWDGNPKVKEKLESLLRNKKMSYEGKDRYKIIEKLNGTGDKLSQSMQQAIEQLKTAKCIG